MSYEFSSVYIQPQFRAPTFLIGLVVGFYTLNKKEVSEVNSKIYFESKFLKFISSFSKKTSNVLTTLSFSILAFLMAGPLVLPSAPSTGIVSSLIFALSRPLWGAATGWIIYSCHAGLNPTLNSFLSHRFWLPMARMGFSIYLTHFFVLLARGVGNDLGDFSFMNFSLEFFFVLFYAFLFHVFVKENFDKLSAKIVAKIP